MKTRRFASVLAVCLVLAAGLRFLGITHGWPRNYIPDTTVVRAALSIGAGANPFAGDPLPTQYPYFLPYLLTVIYGIFFVVGSIAGAFADLRSFEQYAFANPAVFFLIACWVVAAFGCVQVLLVALVTRRLLGDSAAVLAALFSATSLILVQLSHQARPHVVATALIFLALHFTLRHLDERRPRALTLAWLSAGLATSAAPYGVLSIAIPLLGSVRRRDVGYTVRSNLLGIALFLATVILFYPRFIVGDPVAYDSSTGLLRSYGGLYLARTFINGKGFQKLCGWLFLYDPVLTAFAALGIVLAVSRRRWNPRWAVVAVFPLLYVLAYGSYQIIYPRYLVPLIPFLSIPAGWLAARLQSWLAQHASSVWGARFHTPAAVTFAIGLFLLPTTQALRLDVLLQREDTRNIAERWISEHLRGSRLIAAEAHGVELPLDERSLRWTAAHHPDQLGMKDRYRLRLAERDQLEDGFPVLHLWYVEDYRSKAISELEDYAASDHVVAVRPGDQERVDPFYRSVVREGRLLTRVTPLLPNVRFAETQLPLELQHPLWDLWKVERCGPIIEIYELKRE